MSTDTQKEEVMVIQEVADGTAVVDLPPSIPSPDVDDQKVEQNASDDHDEGSDEDDEQAREAEIASGGAIDEDAEALRESKRRKRLRRREYHRQVEQEKNLKIDMLSRMNQQMVERIAILEKKAQGADMGRLNSAIEEQKERVRFAKDRMSHALATGDGDLHTQAQEMWFDSRRNVEALEALKKKSLQPPQQRAIQPQTPPPVNVHAKEWLSNNRWFDPEAKDADSKVALAIDKAMEEEGWDAGTPEYWEEIDNRLQRYIPHRYTRDTDEKPNRRPRNVVTGSGRESVVSRGGNNQFVLSEGQVKAIKEMGWWDDPKKRAKMVENYARYARTQRNNG